MKIKTVHCFFEQSGTFKKEFIKLGYNAYDYDIQNNYDETNCIIDLFDEIEKAYNKNKSIFDDITSEDLIIAFFPCIYFCQSSMSYFCLQNNNYRCLSDEEKINKIIERSNNRTRFFNLLNMLVGVCLSKKLRIIIENPWTQPHYLKANFLKSPTLIDMDRTQRGDCYKKPTAYWFFNCEPTDGFSFQQSKEIKRVWDAAGGKAGICSEERSMISSDYARNFICDFIIEKKQNLKGVLF